MKDLKNNLPWVLLNIAGITYGISCELVLSLRPIDIITPLPDAPPEIRGVIDFRDKIIELIDIQKILGLPNSEDKIKSFYEIMDARRQDHINWLKTLQNCVENVTEFTLTTDPHKCAFGKWYDSYNVDNANILFLSAFSSFDKPHKAIHEIGIKAEQLIKAGKRQEALELIKATKNNELQQMMCLFDEIKRAYKESNREIVVVIGNNKNIISIAVDSILAIEYLKETDEELIRDSMTSSKYLNGFAKRKDGSLVILLNDGFLLKTFSKDTSSC